MTALNDFLAFRTLISPAVLIAVYYFGALVVPLVGWLLLRRVRRRVLAGDGAGWLRTMSDLFASDRSRLLVWLTVAILFGLAELVWRMMFEVMIAYFRMHDLLQQIVAAGGVG